MNEQKQTSYATTVITEHCSCHSNVPRPTQQQIINLLLSHNKLSLHFTSIHKHPILRSHFKYGTRPVKTAALQFVNGSNEHRACNVQRHGTRGTSLKKTVAMNVLSADGTIPLCGTTSSGHQASRYTE